MREAHFIDARHDGIYENAETFTDVLTAYLGFRTGLNVGAKPLSRYMDFEDSADSSVIHNGNYEIGLEPKYPWLSKLALSGFRTVADIFAIRSSREDGSDEDYGIKIESWRRDARINLTVGRLDLAAIVAIEEAVDALELSAALKKMATKNDFTIGTKTAAARHAQWSVSRPPLKAAAPWLVLSADA